MAKTTEHEQRMKPLTINDHSAHDVLSRWPQYRPHTKWYLWRATTVKAIDIVETIACALCARSAESQLLPGLID